MGGKRACVAEIEKVREGEEERKRERKKEEIKTGSGKKEV